jgi:hypothetical protein
MLSSHWYLPNVLQKTLREGRDVPSVFENGGLDVHDARTHLHDMRYLRGKRNKSVKGEGAYSICSLGGHVLAGDPPLRLQHGLDDVAGALAERQLLSRVGFGVAIAADFLHFFQHKAAALESHKPRKLSAFGIHAAVVVEHANHGEAVALRSRSASTAEDTRVETGDEYDNSVS